MSEFYNLDTFAAKLGVTRQTASSKIKQGIYPAFLRGKSYKIPSSLLSLIELKNVLKDIKSAPKTFMIGNHKGGSGKTTGTINIAASLAFFGYKVLLVDMDNQANASTINQLHTQYDFDKKNVTRLLLEMKDRDKESTTKRLKKSLVPIESDFFKNGKLDLLPNSLEWDEKKELLFTYPNAENMLNRLLKPIKEEYDFIIIDTHPSMDIMWRMSVMASDAIIIGMMAEQYSIDGLSGIFRRIYSLNEDYKEIKGHNIEILGAVISNYKKNTTISQLNAPVIKEALEKYCKYNESVVFEPFISHTIKASEQQSLRGPIMFDDPSSNMNAEYLELTVNILYHLYFVDANRN